MKEKIVQIYHCLRYSKARKMLRKGIKFEHFRELNQPWLTALDIRSVLDIGANTGQFAKLAREVFPEANLYSFEPLPECFKRLQEAMGSDGRFHAYNMAIGKEAAFLDFYRSDHSPSSSFLEMEESHKQAFPESNKGHKSSIQVEVQTLDHFFANNKIESPVLLKIDVQGFEGEVLKGAGESLANVAVVIIEMSLIRLYKDQLLFHDIYELMHKNGFSYHGNLSQMSNPRSGEVVQIDAIFINESKKK